MHYCSYDKDSIILTDSQSWDTAWTTQQSGPSQPTKESRSKVLSLSPLSHAPVLHPLAGPLPAPQLITSQLLTKNLPPEKIPAPFILNHPAHNHPLPAKNQPPALTPTNLPNLPHALNQVLLILLFHRGLNSLNVQPLVHEQRYPP